MNPSDRFRTLDNQYDFFHEALSTQIIFWENDLQFCNKKWRIFHHENKHIYDCLADRMRWNNIFFSSVCTDAETPSASVNLTHPNYHLSFVQ